MIRTLTAYHRLQRAQRNSLLSGLCLAATFTLVLSATVSYPVPATAGIFKCVAPDGSVSYSQRECEDNEQTAKVLSNNGRSRKKLDCSVAHRFVKNTVEKMREGVSSGEMFTNYGGMDSLSNFALGAINYVYSYQGNETTTTERLQELTLQKCEVGSFGTPSCYALPTNLINQEGGCNTEPATAAAKPHKTSTPARQTRQRTTNSNSTRTRSVGPGPNRNLSKADQERERRRAERQAKRERLKNSRKP